MRYIRIFLPWVILLGVAYLGFHYIWPLFLPEEAEMDVQTTEVQRGDLRRIVPADGLLKPAVLVEVKSRASGVVELISVEPGDIVEAGAVLVELDKEQILARQRQAEAGLQSSKASLSKIKRSLSPQQRASAEASVRQAEISFEQAEDQYNRILELHAKGYATDEELENAKAQLDSARISFENAKEQLELDLIGGEEEDIAVAEANVAIREAELDDVNEELANTTIRAPISGTVLTRPVELGTAVASGTSGMSGGTVVATIGDMSTLYIEARIDETDLGRVTIGMPCRISFDAYVGQMWPGKLSKVYPQGEENQGGGTRFLVEVELESGTPQVDSAPAPSDNGGGRNMPGGRPGRGNPHGEAPPSKGEEALPEAAPELRPNMTANVEFVLDNHPDVLILAARFVQYDDDRNPYCEVLPDPEDQEKRERREIKLGFSDGMRFEVTDGLEEGDTVVLERPIIEDNGF